MPIEAYLVSLSQYMNPVLYILGCGSAFPTAHRNPSSQVLDYRGQLYMFDCGEGTQKQMRSMHLAMDKLTHIFISHMHGDHCLGLPGLLSTLSMGKHGGELHVWLPCGGVEMVQGMIDFFCGDMTYRVSLHPIEGKQRCTLVETDAMRIEAFPLCHRMPCYGYMFSEKPKPRHLRGDMLEFYKVPVWQRNSLKQGADYVVPETGQVIANARLTTDPTPSVSYAYCSDTAFSPSVAECVKGVDTLYHEATYTTELEQQAAARGHSTAAQAARVALMADAGRLVIGHYSKRYSRPDALVAEAKEVYGREVIAATEGMKLQL